MTHEGTERRCNVLMRRIKVILAAVAAVVTITMLAAPATAQEFTSCDPVSGICSTVNPNTGTLGNGLDPEDCFWSSFWDWNEGEWVPVLVCD